jgi:hypothetical protein
MRYARATQKRVRDVSRLSTGVEDHASKSSARKRVPPRRASSARF